MTPDEEASELLPCVFANWQPVGSKRCEADRHAMDCPAHYRPAVAERLANYREQVRQRDESFAALNRIYERTRSQLHERIAALQAENERLRAAILWVLGEDSDFAPRQQGQGPYWWRKELRARAGCGTVETRSRMHDIAMRNRDKRIAALEGALQFYARNEAVGFDGGLRARAALAGMDECTCTPSCGCSPGCHCKIHHE